MSGIPPNAPWRGCASSFPLPPSQEDVQQAENWTRALQQHNGDDNIVYRPGDGEYDILHHVLRWNNTNYEQVFENGFRARPQDDTDNNVYFNLEHHVNHGGVPGSLSRRIPHAFVSTTLSIAYYPPVHDDSTPIYRYEIYAPGGIWVAQTLDSYRYSRHRRQDEVAFVGGIAPQYIRSAQRFTPIYDANRGRRIWQPADTQLIINHNFNPRLLYIQNPIVDRRRGVRLEIIFYEPPHAERRKREVSTATDSNTIHWYAEQVANEETYIDASFRSSNENEVYLFMKYECVLVNYAPGSKDGKVIDGPRLICDVFPFLADTAFAEYGIDCAFRSYDREEAFIFSGNLCAHINYAPGTTNGNILKGPTTIVKMFPFFKGTAFESGVDASFDLSRGYEAYLFKDDQYARINYSSDNSQLIGAIRHISEGFPSLKGTIFESRIDAAFTSHKYDGWLSKTYYETGISEEDSSTRINIVPVTQNEADEAYIFKGNSYALINFVPDTGNDHIVDQVKPILSDWPSLCDVLPHKNVGLDVHDHTATPQAHHADTPTPPDHPAHDEL